MSNKLNIEPRVRSLVSYLNDIENGTLQVPAFQRDYVWDKDDIKELFDSIKNSYPIGSILLWKPDQTIGSDKKTIGSYSTPKDSKEKIYILDGFQRLSTLFGCLINPEKTQLKRDLSEWNDKFNLYYDLEEEVFTYIRINTVPEPFQIPVYILMNSSDFRQYTRKEFEKVNEETKINSYYDRADLLSRAFLDYQIACVDIKSANISEAVDIFSRINSKGLPISLDWMANALSIKHGFTFSDEIDNLLEELKQYNFHNINRDVIFRCVQSSFGKLYIDNARIEVLAKRDDFGFVTKAVLPKVKAAVKFLYEELLVLDSKLLPYNIQLVFIMDFFKKFEYPTEEQKTKLKEWFWITTYSNYFTIYSLANQRKAYQHFQLFLDGKEEHPVFNDRPRERFVISSLSSKLTLGSVRTKAFVLFLLNYSNSFDINEENSPTSVSLQSFKPINSEEIQDFELEKIFYNHFEPENIIPVFSKFMIPNLLLNRKEKDLSFILNQPYQRDFEKYFIKPQMLHFFKIYQTFERENQILALRKEHIQFVEKHFVNSFDMLGYEYW